MEKKIVYKVEEGMNRDEILCTTYQMRNMYDQLGDGFFQAIDIMNYIQHYRAAELSKKGMDVLDVCCGRSLMLPLLRYYSKSINSYTGVDISEKNIEEAKKGASRSVRNMLLKKPLDKYYPFEVAWILSNVAEMTNYIKANSKDFIIYTSSIEHMHKDMGYQSLEECYQILKSGGFMFLSCPNTPGDGYDTQYKAHVYEWGYQELKDALAEVGFTVEKEVGLYVGTKDLDEYYLNKSDDLKQVYLAIKEYLPADFLRVTMSVPIPEKSKEVLFIVTKRKWGS